MSSTNGHRWFAAVWERIGNSAKDVREEIAGGAKGRILEIGAGTGFNFPYYSDPADVVATEPDPYMVKRARRRAEDLGNGLSIEQTGVESLPFDDDSFDTVVCTLVMCSVADPTQAFSEIRRVLKPGGEFRFYEHVRSENRLLSMVQDVVTPASRWLGAGCHQNRDTVAYIRQAGFEIRRLDRAGRFEVKGVAVPA